jgi:hypothetical protein
MTALSFSQHATVRCAQRGIPLDDAELIMLIGSEISDGYLVRAKDCQAVERKLKEAITRIRRLKGKRLVVADGRVITAFHATTPEHRRLLRRSEKRALEYAP